MTTSVAYFIMLHHKPEQFEWLLRAIYTPDDLFLVHVDLKSRLGIKRSRRGLMREVRRICADKPNIILMRSRFTNWGGWSLSRVLLAAIREALRRGAGWSHFINLSGQCYPLKPIAQIKQELAQTGEQPFIEMRSFDSLPADDWHLGDNRMLETPLRALRLRGRVAPPRDFQITHKGSQWVILPRTFCEWIVKSPMTKRVARHMKRVLLTDELVMQTLAMNSPFSGKIAAHYRRAIYWPGPKVLTTSDLPALEASGAWFGRKFDVVNHGDVLRLLASRNRFPHP